MYSYVYIVYMHVYETIAVMPKWVYSPAFTEGPPTCASWNIYPLDFTFLDEEN